jgi:hypothetical protein
MRLFIAREALDAHMRLVGKLMDPRQPLPAKLAVAVRAVLRYSVWYPQQWLAWAGWPKYRRFEALAGHMRFVERAAHRMARELFHGAMRYQAKLAYRQQFLARLVDVGAELFAMAAACSRAQALARRAPQDRSPVDLADGYCRLARRRIHQMMSELWRNDDRTRTRLSEKLLDGRLAWLEEGIV